MMGTHVIHYDYGCLSKVGSDVDFRYSENFSVLVPSIRMEDRIVVVLGVLTGEESILHVHRLKHGHNAVLYSY